MFHVFIIPDLLVFVCLSDLGNILLKFRRFCFSATLITIHLKYGMLLITARVPISCEY